MVCGEPRGVWRRSAPFLLLITKIMRKILLSLLLAFCSSMYFYAQEVDSSRLRENLEQNLMVMDSCYNMLQSGNLSARERENYYRLYHTSNVDYKKTLKQYKKLNGSPINDAGRYMIKSSNLEIGALSAAGACAILTPVLATQINAKNNTAIATAVGVSTGATALGLYIASILNKRKAGKILSDVRFTGNGFVYSF